MVTLGLQQPLGLFFRLKTLTQHFMAEIMDIFVKTIKFLSFNATTLYQKVVGVSGGVSGVCVTMFRVHGGLRTGTGLSCQQWPLWPLLPGAITGHLWQPCHGKRGNLQTRH